MIHKNILAGTWLVESLFHSLPILLHDLVLFKYELAFLVLLGFLVGSLVLPSEHLAAVTAVDVGDRVKPRHELPVLLGPRGDVHGVRGEKCAAIPPLEGLGDDIVVEADAVPAMAAAVHPRLGQFRHLQPILNAPRVPVVRPPCP